ncbi:MAG TPA: hypothetical protein VEG38_10690, partial [Acidimicrobiia bacterium]|nr:hypothetical protein [Acidimicrobiia bacterium]
AVVVAALAGLAGPGSAHSGGRVQLFVDHLGLHPTGGDVWTLSLEMVDADSGSPAPGFDVIAEASDDNGHAAGPVTLTDGGDGRYSGSFTALPGKWRLAIRAQSLPGGTPGVPLRKVYPLVLEPGKDVSIGAGSRRGGPGSGLAVPAVSAAATAAVLGWFFRGRRRSAVRGVAVVALAVTGVAGGAARPGEAATASDVRVRVERADTVGQTPLWIPVRVTVTDGTGGALSVDHLVFAAARNSRGDEAGPFNLGPLEANDPTARGVHQGFIIVPYGGPWTITAVARTAHADPGVASATLGRGSAEIVVDAPVSVAAPDPSVEGGSGGPESEPLGVAVLWLHTVFSIGWGIAIALLALLALPAGRRLLSDYGANLFDGQLDRLSRTAWWLTGLVVGTGIYNLVNSVAYRFPLSPEQARRLFRLPFAQSYYLTLGVKLAAYAAMVAAAVPLIAEARRQAALDHTNEVSVVDDGPSPWEKPERLQAAESTGGVALRSKAADVGLAADPAGPPGAVGRARLPVAVMIVGAMVIVAAVTLLKYFHLLGELSRLAG